MTLSDFTIKNSVFAWVVMFGLLLFGFIGFSQMGISQLPDVDFPVVNVTVTWTGASPLTMETAVADIIEDALMTVEGIKNIQSVSSEGRTSITVDFGFDIDINVAMQEVQSKILQAQRNLPNDIDPPIISKTNPEDQPIMFLALYGSEDRRRLVLHLRDYLRDAMSTVDGVGDVRLGGGYVEPNMRIWLDRNRMNRLEITVEDVIAAVRGQHLLTPSGFMEDGHKETNVMILSELGSAKEFSDLQIPSRRGENILLPIRIRDIAVVEEGLADIRRTARFNRELTANIGIIKQRGSNAVAVSKAVRQRIESIKDVIPSDINLGVIWDITGFIESAINRLYINLILSLVLTSLVCWFFLGSFRSAINVIIAIPVAIVGSFIFLNAFGFTLNNFTLLALSLSIGLVVDDTIMMLENIVRHNKSGRSRIEAAITGAKEIRTPAIASTLVILTVFAPVFFIEGIVGKYFFQFGVALFVALGLSLFEALNLAPMRCSRMLDNPKENRMSVFADKMMGTLTKLYLRILKFSFGHRKKILAIVAILFISSLTLIPGLRKEMVPPQDQSRFFVTVQLPMGSSLEYTNTIMEQVEDILEERSEVERFLVFVGGFSAGVSTVNTGTAQIIMKDPKDRGVSEPFKKRPTQQEFMAFLRNEIREIPGVLRVSVMDLSLTGFSARRGFPIEFVVQGRSWDDLEKYSRQIMTAMEESGLMSDIDTDYRPSMPEIRIKPDRVKAGNMGVTIANIADTISATVSSLRISKYTDEAGKRNDIRIALMDKHNRTEQDIKQIRVRNNFGELVPLSDVVSTESGPSMFSITRYNRQRSVSVFANIVAGKSQAEAIEYIRSTASEILPEGYHVSFTGSSQAFADSFNSLYIALILGIMVVYMVLATQFNSFLHPLIILLALPFSITGAIFALKFSGISLNMYSMIGILMLMGIVTKNSILLVEFTNRTRENLMFGVNDALLYACPIRFRPIIMTSVSTIAAAIPPALAFGAGGETVRPMATVIIGGVFLSTLLTLVIVPCAYSLTSRFESAKHKKTLEEAKSLFENIKGKGKSDAVAMKKKPNLAQNNRKT